MYDNDKQNINDIDYLVNEIVNKCRCRPCLVLYYPDHYTYICDDDIEDVDNIFRKLGYDDKNKIKDLDVLLHTNGGDPNSAYQIAQVIREFSEEVTFLVPISAVSAGTIMCLCADDILLGDYGVLSSIDISFGEDMLININYFRDFAIKCRVKIEDIFKDKNYTDAETSVESELLKAMTIDVGAMKIGHMYREQRLTGAYARKLMSDYMFKDELNNDNRIEKIINEILYENPSHEYRMDFNICEELELPVRRMDSKLFDKTKSLIFKLQDLVTKNVICGDIHGDGNCGDEDKDFYKQPYFFLYEKDNKNNSSEMQDKIYKRRKDLQKFRENQ
jgi:hypothetical protein